MTNSHQILPWLVAIVALINVVGAAFSIARAYAPNGSPERVLAFARVAKTMTVIVAAVTAAVIATAIASMTH